jgi:hypothetical protein
MQQEVGSRRRRAGHGGNGEEADVVDQIRDALAPIYDPVERVTCGSSLTGSFVAKVEPSGEAEELGFTRFVPRLEVAAALQERQKPRLRTACRCCLVLWR